jgi:putative transcriptional regulator
MTLKHHPSDAALAEFAAGTLDQARALVVASHLHFCRQCRDAVRGFETLGGALLEGIAPAALAPDALQRIMGRLSIEEQVALAPPAAPPSSGEFPDPLSQYAMGPWRWIGRGVQWRPVQIESKEGVRTFMLKAAPGTKLPRHRHTGTEWTCVFQGAFRHELGRYGPGEFDEADETIEHDPVVEEGNVCICLVALQGDIKFQSWMGRLLQPFVRI